MIQLDPNGRPTFDTLLHTSRGTVFPEAFYSFLHNYVSTINDISLSTSYANTPGPTTPSGTSTSTQPPRSSVAEETRPSDSDHRLERLWEDYESIEPYLYPESNHESENIMKVNVEYSSTVNADYKPLQVRVCSTNMVFLFTHHEYRMSSP